MLSYGTALETSYAKNIVIFTMMLIFKYTISEDEVTLVLESLKTGHSHHSELSLIHKTVVTLIS
jgi:hypothetical protein